MNANTINSKNVISGVNDLATKCPKISAMWSFKNTYTPSEVSVGSNKKAWFVCPNCKQEFEARVFHVARSLMRGNTGCPVCAGLKVVPGINDLATKCPKIFAMWSAKNTYTPGEVSAGSNKKAWFVCPDCKQEFEASICNVVHTVQNGSTGCPVCAGRKVVSVSMIWLPSALWPLPCGVTRTIALPVKYLQATTRRYGSYAPTASRNLRLLFAMSLNP